MSEEAKAKARTLMSLLNGHQPDLWSELLTPDFVSYDPIFPGGVLRGRDENIQFMKGLLAAFPDLHGTVDDLVSEGDKVGYRWTMTGTHRGEMMGIAPTNKKVSVEGISILRVKGSRIAEEWVNWDSMGLMQQLGVVPKPS